MKGYSVFVEKFEDGELEPIFSKELSKHNKFFEALTSLVDRINKASESNEGCVEFFIKDRSNMLELDKYLLESKLRFIEFNKDETKVSIVLEESEIESRLDIYKHFFEIYEEDKFDLFIALKYGELVIVKR